jgi:hypothetical protein
MDRNGELGSQANMRWSNREGDGFDCSPADSGDSATGSPASVTDRLPDRELLAAFRIDSWLAVTNVRRPPSAPVTATLALRVTDIWRRFAFALLCGSCSPPSRILVFT